MAEDKGINLPITQLSGLQINYKDSNSCLNPPIVTTIERNALINSNDPANKIKAGTIVYNSDDNAMQVFQGGDWVALEAGAGGDVSVNGATIVGNLAKFNRIDGKLIADSGIALAEVGTVKTNGIPTSRNLACFDGITGNLITDSGINVVPVVPVAKIANEVNATSLYRLSNLAALQFGNNTNIADTGVILVDGLTPITFQTQGTGVDAQVCTVINGELGAGSSSPSALLEINNTTGGFLHSRLTTAQRDALVTPVDGTEIFNITTKKLNIRSNGAWVELGDSSGGGITGPTVSTKNSLTFWDSETGSSVASSDITVSDYVIDAEQNKIKSTLNNVGNINFHSSGSNRRIYIDPSAGGGGSNPNQIFIDGDLEIKCLYTGMNMTAPSNDAAFSVVLLGGIGGQSWLTLSDSHGTLKILKPYTAASGTALSWQFPNTNGNSGQVLTNIGGGDTQWSNIGDVLTKPLVTSDSSVNISRFDNISHIIADTVNNNIVITIPQPSTSPYSDGNVGKIYTIKAIISNSRTVGVKWGIVENPEIVISSTTSTLTIISTGTTWTILSKTTTY